MLELAKFAKHHIPEEHELDDQADYNSFHNHHQFSLHKRGSNNENQNTQMWINENSAVHLYDISQLITAKNDEKTVKQSEKTENNNEKEKKIS